MSRLLCDIPFDECLGVRVRSANDLYDGVVVKLHPEDRHPSLDIKWVGVDTISFGVFHSWCNLKVLMNE